MRFLSKVLCDCIDGVRRVAAEVGQGKINERSGPGNDEASSFITRPSLQACRHSFVGPSGQNECRHQGGEVPTIVCLPDLVDERLQRSVLVLLLQLLVGPCQHQGSEAVCLMLGFSQEHFSSRGCVARPGTGGPK